MAGDLPIADRVRNLRANADNARIAARVAEDQARAYREIAEELDRDASELMAAEREEGEG